MKQANILIDTIEIIMKQFVNMADTVNTADYDVPSCVCSLKFWFLYLG